ncbi:MAG: hypothetical protein A2381_08305 [Bdellovibrionales bacterium RIFOXYB1_FULL_37_110]|nr:MAG: hypothetical protein A2417_12155 [Bdellovibrionales bacterium RIFOXYC1_FULL_37_79]OFZ60082.1 MAG: hypothetical protein A2381_08305 [Bdellovibrionales bacterium RIFOXYB1_FULL_37_110]OFZ64922.1 MAG: hypothetical protein A2577_02075 [Bdellovibrionales bacterium RIFOXYD1_FULL_36_51]
MFKRDLVLPTNSFLLFGPRSTGKSTWLGEKLPDAIKIDLLSNREFLSFFNNPSLLQQIVQNAPINKWIVIDEIQKIPALLDEVHKAMYESQGKRKFALTGSSARKIKRSNGNMLAGRALTRNLFPLTLNELDGALSLESILKYGTLPIISSQKDTEIKADFLESYVSTYMKEEIQQEALVKKLDSFSRFLEVMAILNGQILNVSNVASNAKVARTTINGYIEILCDTLLGYLLPSWRPKHKVKEINHPKFYFFDTGVIRTISGKLRDSLDSEERGRLFETLIVNELKATNSYKKLGAEFFYWKTADGAEVDLIMKVGKKILGFEIKSTDSWKSKYSKNLNQMAEEGIITKAFGVYTGKYSLKDDRVTVIPYTDLVSTILNVL